MSDSVSPSRPFSASVRLGSDFLRSPPPLIEILPIAIYACAADGRLCWYNRCAADLWGREPCREGGEYFSGAYKLYTLDGAPLPHGDAPMAQVLRTGIPVRNREVTIERSDGTRITVWVNIDPILGEDGTLLGAINCFHDATRFMRAEEARREREKWFRELLEGLPAALYTTDAEGRITFYNEAAAALWGRRAVLGDNQWCGAWRLRRPDGDLLPHEECPMAVALKEGRAIRGTEAIVERSDGTLIPFMAYPTPLRDGTGKVIGAVNMLVDISDRKQAEERQKTLLDELNHRVKNTLATVQSLATQTFVSADLPREVQDAFGGRLLALSRAHNLLTNSGWRMADLKTVIREILEPYRDGSVNRIRLAGAAVRLRPQAALLFAMIFHELATNAAKYGALSSRSGAVDVSWRLSDDGRLHLDWLESGGPAVGQPARRGFGSRLVERGIASELQGGAEIDYRRQGLRCAINVPVANCLAG